MYVIPTLEVGTEPTNAGAEDMDSIIYSDIPKVSKNTLTNYVYIKKKSTNDVGFFLLKKKSKFDFMLLPFFTTS